MTEERWEQIKEMANNNFEVLENTVIDLPEDQGGGTKETLIFNGPLGKIKLEFIIKPLVLDKKTIYSKRSGQETKIDYVTSDTEKVRTLLAFRWDKANENWVGVDSAQFD
ncbi:MAG: hypothetical protein GF365_00550 [Candidatus Buchananbacteria bacterium]|nr:hypothetical protein [Candidatus Buchananbacteria bacterium]